MFHLREENYYSIQEIENAKENEIILHFVNLLGHPWEEGCLCPLSELWEEYYKKAWKKELHKIDPIKS